MKTIYRCVALAMLAQAIVLPSRAADVQFSLAGFSGGGVLSGAFSGQDLDGNGVISSFDAGGEITAFRLSFAGDAWIADFQAGLPELQSLVLVLGGPPLWGNDTLPAPEGLWVVKGSVNVLAGLGALGEAGAVVSDLELDAASLAPQPIGLVPEPAGWCLLLAGAAVLRRCQPKAAARPR